MTRKYQILFWVIFCSLLLSSVLADDTSPATSSPTSAGRIISLAWSPDGKYIAFTSYRSGNYDIWVVDTNSLNLINVTEADPDSNFFFSWSPDGGQIAFTSQPIGSSTSDIWIVSRDGTNMMDLTEELTKNDRFFYSNPVWSPDGKFISFDSQSNVLSDVMIINLIDKTEKNLSKDLGGYNSWASWSPDSHFVVFTSTDFIDPQIWISQVDQSSLVKLIPGIKKMFPNDEGVTSISEISWSPNDDLIAFVASRGVHANIFTITKDGSNISDLTQNLALINTSPVWSPDGKQIAFQALDQESLGEGTTDIWIINADGSGSMNLTLNTNSRNSFPAWSPDGKQIAFESNRTGNSDIWVMNADGSNPINMSEK